MKKHGVIISLVFLVFALLMGGCSQVELQGKHKKKAAAPQQTAKPVSYWDGDEASGTPHIEIAISEQRAYFYRGEQLVGVSRVSTGKKGFETPPGRYKVIQKDKNHVSNLYGEYIDAEGNILQKNVDVTKDPMPPGATFKGAKMSYFLRFTEGYGMHAGYLPGYRASHGCIRMPRLMAEHFFANVALGTPVTVKE